MSSDDLAEAIKKARYNESVIVTVNDDGETSRELVLVPCLDEENGGVIWNDAIPMLDASSQEGSNAASFPPRSTVALHRHLRTKRWMFPMLNDKRRNILYEEAIRNACKEVQRRFPQDSITTATIATTATTIATTISNAKEAPTKGEIDHIDALDIGSGTGLLAMMVSRHLPPSSKVLSYEMASAMARIAQQTTRDNNLEGRLAIKEAHSCEVPPSMPPKVLCTSELLESGLLGEGWLPAMRDAWKRHLHPKAVVVPQGARIFAQLVQDTSKDGCIRNLWGPHHALSQGFPDNRSFQMCTSSKLNAETVLLGGQQQQQAFHVPLHTSKLLRDPSSLRLLSDPISVLEIDVTSPESIPSPEGQTSRHSVVANVDGKVDGILFWWDLELWKHSSGTGKHAAGSINYSTSPHQFDQNWQDHWHPCIYVLPHTNEEFSPNCCVQKGQSITLIASHDDSKIWFKLLDTDDNKNTPDVGSGNSPQGQTSPPSKRSRLNRTGKEPNASSADTNVESRVCQQLISPDRALQLNDVERLRKFQETIGNALDVLHTKSSRRSVVLDISDMGICGMMASLLGAHDVTSLESSSGDLPYTAARIAQLGNALPIPNDDGGDFQIVQCQAEQLTLDNILGNTAVNLVVGEPYYEILEGWHLQEALNYFYLLAGFRKRGVISDNAQIIPAAASVKACIIQSVNLASAYKSCENPLCGFDHSAVNQLGGNFSAYDLCLPMVSQYDFSVLSETFEIAKINYMTQEINGGKKTPITKGRILKPGTCHAALIWIEYNLGNDLVVPTNTSCHRQMVRMLDDPTKVTVDDIEAGAFVEFEAHFGSSSPKVSKIDSHHFEIRINRQQNE